MPSAALVAVTEQVATCDADNVVPVTLQPVPVTENVTAPLPEPPECVNVIGVPATPERTTLETTSVACGAPEKVNVVGAVDSAA